MRKSIIAAFVWSVSSLLLGNDCEKFNGSWSSEDGNGAVQSLTISDCKLLERDVIGPWNKLHLDNQLYSYNGYGNDKWIQNVRGSWHDDYSTLIIEEVDWKLKGFNPAFDPGNSNYRLVTLSVSSSKPDILISKSRGFGIALKNNLDSENIKIDIYHRVI